MEITGTAGCCPWLLCCAPSFSGLEGAAWAWACAGMLGMMGIPAGGGGIIGGGPGNRMPMGGTNGGADRNPRRTWEPPLPSGDCFILWGADSSVTQRPSAGRRALHRIDWYEGGIEAGVEPMKSRLSRGYSRSAPLYELTAAPFYAKGFRRLLPLLRVPPSPAVLDVGTGTGVNLVEAARWFAPARLLCGIDISPGMISIASQKAARMGIPAHFTIGDAEHLPYPDGLFDLVICNSVFHWFKNRAAAMAEMRRVLRPGGQLLLICAAAQGFKEWFTLLDVTARTLLGQRGTMDVPAFPSALEIARLMAACGLLIQHLANPTVVCPVLLPEPFIKMMGVVAPHWAADLTPVEQNLVEQAAAAAMRRTPGGFPVTWSSVEAVGLRAF